MEIKQHTESTSTHRTTTELAPTRPPATPPQIAAQYHPAVPSSQASKHNSKTDQQAFSRFTTVGKLTEVEQSGTYVDRGTCQFDRCYPLKSTHGCETMADELTSRMQTHTRNTHDTDGHTYTNNTTSSNTTSNTDTTQDSKQASH